MRNYEFTAEEMADMLLNFIRDMGDDKELIEEEKSHVADLLYELRKSEDFEILATYLDVMFLILNDYNLSENAEIWILCQIFLPWILQQSITV